MIWFQCQLCGVCFCDEFKQAYLAVTRHLWRVHGRTDD